MGFKYFVKEHVREGIVVQTIRNGILKVNHLLFDEVFKREETHLCWG